MDLFIFALIVPILIVIVLVWSCVRARMRRVTQAPSDQPHSAEYPANLRVFDDEVPSETLFYYRYYPAVSWSQAQAMQAASVPGAVPFNAQGGLYVPPNNMNTSNSGNNSAPLILPATVIATGSLSGLEVNGTAGDHGSLFPQVQPRPLYGEGGLYSSATAGTSSISTTTTAANNGNNNYSSSAGNVSCEVDENGNALPDASEVYGTATYLPRPPEKTPAKGKWGQGDAVAMGSAKYFALFALCALVLLTLIVVCVRRSKNKRLAQQQQQQQQQQIGNSPSHHDSKYSTPQQPPPHYNPNTAYGGPTQPATGIVVGGGGPNPMYGPGPNYSPANPPPLPQPQPGNGAGYYGLPPPQQPPPVVITNPPPLYGNYVPPNPNAGGNGLPPPLYNTPMYPPQPTTAPQNPSGGKGGASGIAPL